MIQSKGFRCPQRPRAGAAHYRLRDLAFPAYVALEVTLDPGILFLVLNTGKRGQERVFWKYISPRFLASLDFSKDSAVIRFTGGGAVKKTGKGIRFTGGDEIKNTEESGDDFVCSWTGSPTTTPWAFGRPLSVGLYSLYSQGAGPRVQFRQGGHPQQQFRADLPRHFLYSHHPCKGKIKNLLECGYNQSDYRRVRQGDRRPVGSEYHQNTISECRGSRTATRLLTFGLHGV